MSIKEVRQALGSWGIKLKAETPVELIAEIERNKFGHICIIPGRINPKQYNDGMLRAARYVGVYRSTFKQSDDTVEIKGSGMAFWLGDEDEKGDIHETAVVLNAATFANSIRALLPPGGAVTEGTLYSIPGGGTYTGRHQWETPRKAITYVTDTYSSGDDLVEWRVNGDATLDAGPIADLYRMTPQAILVKKDTGRDMRLLGLRADMSMDYDVEDLTTRIVLLAQGEGTTITTGTADADPTGYTDLNGNPIKQTRLVSESGTESGNANVRAQLQLKRWSAPRQAIQIRTDEFDIKGDFVVGDYIYVFDPEAGFYDLDNEVFWKGQPINPIALRVTQMDWNVRANWTVAFRKNNGEWLDLSEYYKADGGGSTLAVGDYRRTLAGNNYESLGFRPNLPNPGSDTTVPDAPDFTGFSVGSYQSETMQWVKSAIRAEWDEPLNTDASTITDGDHYEIRFRPNQVIGYQVSWDDLAGYNIAFEDTFDRTSSDTWGADWTLAGDDAANFDVDGDKGTMLIDTANIKLTASHTATSLADVDVIVGPLTISSAVSGANMEIGVKARYVDANNYVDARIIRRASQGDAVAVLRQMVAGVETYTSFPVVPLSAGTSDIWIRLQAIGSMLYMNAWVDGSTEATDWLLELETTHTSAGTFELMGWGYTGSAVPRTIGFGSFKATDLSSAGSYAWDDLGTWDGLVSESVSADPQWNSVFAGWDTNSYTIMELTPGIQYELQIRAADSSSPPNLSAWSASSYVTTLGDIFAPSTPAAPIVAGSMVAIQVQHNLGKASGGEFNLEADLHHLDVHVGGSENFLCNEANKVGELIATGAMASAQIPAVGSFKVDNVDDVYVRVVAVDISGNRSQAGTAAQATIELIDSAHISDLTASKITAGTMTAAVILGGSIKTANNGARVEMDSDGIRLYNTDGDETVNLDSTDGSASFTGEINTELNGAGIQLFSFNNQAYQYFAIRDSSTGRTLDHFVFTKAYELGGFFGQALEQGIRTSVDVEQDGSKILLTEKATVISHQPAEGEEAYMALGEWPGSDIGGGRIYFQGKFNRAYVVDGNAALWTQKEDIGAGFSGTIQVYGATMSDIMCPVATITGAIGDSHVITAASSTGFTLSWNGAAAHNIYVWAFRVESS